jgi:superfamily II DNA/RNA helicase
VQQIGQVATSLFKDTNYRTFTLIGGANVNHQVNHLRDHRPQILIATPGRLAEIVFKLEKLRLGSVKVVVVDEVDSLMSEPYIGEVDTLLQATPLYSRASSSKPNLHELRSTDSRESKEPIEDSPQQAQVEAVGNTVSSPSAAASAAQTMQRLLWLASATSKDAAVGAFADRYTARRGKGWSEITVTGGSALPAGITHGLISISRERAPEMLKRVLTSKPAVRSALIFVNDPRRVEAVCRDLERSGIVSAPLHGEASKDDRRVRKSTCIKLAAPLLPVTNT